MLALTPMMLAGKGSEAPFSPPTSPSSMRARRRAGFEGLSLQCKTEGDLPVMITECGFEDTISSYFPSIDRIDAVRTAERAKFGQANVVRGAASVMTAPSLPVMKLGAEVSEGDEQSVSAGSRQVPSLSVMKLGAEDRAGVMTTASLPMMKLGGEDNHSDSSSDSASEASEGDAQSISDACLPTECGAH